MANDRAASRSQTEWSTVFLVRYVVSLNKGKILLLKKNGYWEARPAETTAFYIIPTQCVIKWEGEPCKHTITANGHQIL